MKEHLKRVAKVFTGTTPPTNINRYYDAEDVLWFSPGDIPSDGIGTSEPRKISKSFFDEYGIKYYPAHSVLMVGIGATVGKVGYSDRPFYTNQQINTIVFNGRKILPKYGAYFLLNKSNEINKKTPIVTLQIFNQSKVKQVLMDYPSIDVQQRIVDYLDEKLAKIDERIKVLEKQKDAYARLKKSVIHQAVTHGLNLNVPLKDSGVEWIGLIPEHWEVKRIKELCSFVSRGATPNYVDEGEYKVMNQAVFSTGNLNHKVVRYSSYMKSESQIKKGDLLIASTGGGVLGKLYFFDDEDLNFYADTHVTIVRSEKGLFCVKFLFYLLSYQFDMVNACMAKGSTNQTELQRDCLLSYELAIPSLVEQQTIIAYLDEKCAKIDAAIENIGKQIDASKRLKRALINEVITGQRAV